MKTVIFNALIFLFLNNAIWVQGQDRPLEALRPAELKNLGHAAEKEGRFREAIGYYSACLKKKPGRHELAWRVAELASSLRDYPLAAHYYGMCATLKPRRYPLADYQAALALKMSGRCDTAIQVFQKFITKNKHKPSEGTQYRKAAQNEIRGCELSDSLRQHPLPLTLVHLDSSINKPNVEFSPILLADSLLLYGSMILPSGEDTSQNPPVKKFYVAERQNGQWKGGIEMAGEVNDSYIHVGNGCVSPDMMRFYFSRCEPDDQGKVVCELYVIRSVNGQWKTPRKLNRQINMPGFTSTQPAVATDSKREREILYFVSDRPGGRGGTDIWYSIYDKVTRKYTDPVNAGSRINSPGDETTPFFHNATRTLFFSSNGFPSAGGFDIFKSNGEKKNWTSPINVGMPLNSASDDLYFITSQSGEEGFFVSNRPGGVGLDNETCCDDIYYYRSNAFVNLEVHGRIILPTDSVVPPLADSLASAPTVVSLYVADEKGKYFVVQEWFPGQTDSYKLPLLPGKNYRIQVRKPGYLATTRDFATNANELDQQIDLDLELKPLPLQPIILSNIYFDFDKWDLADASKSALDSTLIRMMQENDDIRIELSAHTDSKGDDAYNLSLSQKRAASVMDYVIGRGISRDRLVAVGKGETEPLAPNTLPDGSDNPEGRSINRRIEFKIIQEPKAIY